MSAQWFIILEHLSSTAAVNQIGIPIRSRLGRYAYPWRL